MAEAVVRLVGARPAPVKMKQEGDMQAILEP
jgi:hypothetical protein